MRSALEREQLISSMRGRNDPARYDAILHQRTGHLVLKANSGLLFVSGEMLAGNCCTIVTPMQDLAAMIGWRQKGSGSIGEAQVQLQSTEALLEK